jgi:hypothetical protein
MPISDSHRKLNPKGSNFFGEVEVEVEVEGEEEARLPHYANEMHYCVPLVPPLHSHIH